MKTVMQQSAKFVAPGHGPAISVRGVDHVRKISGEETTGTFAFLEVVVPPGGGPPPHVHSREDELFYVLAGTIDIMLGAQTYHASAGSLAYLPRGIAHTFHNSSDTAARFVGLITPPDFVGYFDDLNKLTARPDFQITEMGKLGQAYGLEFGQDRLAQYTGPNAMGEYGMVVTPAEGRCTPYQGGSATILLAAADTDAVIAAGVTTIPPAGGPPSHVHQTFDELFYVLEGEFLFQADGCDIVAPCGSTIYVPRGVVHQFRCTSEMPGRLLTYWTPAGFEEWFFQISALEQKGGMTWEAMRPIAQRLDTTVMMDLPQMRDLTPMTISALRQPAAGTLAVPA